MYDPKGNGKEKSIAEVQFTEVEPPQHLRGIVHRYLELNTNGPLAEDYKFHALPDACTYIVFDQLDRSIAGVSKLSAKSEEFNLGKSFHFVNIRFLPGVWQSTQNEVVYGLVNSAYSGNLPLLQVNAQLAAQEFSDSQDILSDLVDALLLRGLVSPNPVVEKVFQNLDDINSVAQMAYVCGLSSRQLQRILKRTTGFTPHDFLKVLRLQQSLNGSDTWSYADQPHFIHSFRNATGYTPGRYANKYDV